MGCGPSKLPRRSRRKRGSRSRRREHRRVRPEVVTPQVEPEISIPPSEYHQQGNGMTVYFADTEQFRGPAGTFQEKVLMSEQGTNSEYQSTAGKSTAFSQSSRTSRTSRTSRLTTRRENVAFKQATYTGIHNMMVHNEDSKDCRIRGAQFLPNGCLVVCDQANYRLKLWSATFQYLSHVTLPGKPHDVCVYAANKTGCDIYVTVPSDRTILEFYVEGKIIAAGVTIRTDGWCYGIAPYKKGLVACVGTKIQFIDTDGKIEKTLQYDKNGNSLFGSPLHIAVTSGKNLLISDSFKRYVVCMTPKGEELFKYEEMAVPHGVMVDSNGTIFLCGSDDTVVDVVHQITHEGVKVKSLLSWRHVGFKPDCLCIREKDQILAICGENDRIKTFRLETKQSGKIQANDAVMETVSIHTGRSTPEVQQLMKRILRTS